MIDHMQEEIEDYPNLLTEADVHQRVDDWIERLRNLRLSVERWIAEEPQHELSVIDAPAVPMLERMMVEFKIPSELMPAFSVMKGEQILALFRPVALWVIGANGRIDIVTRKSAPILIDTAPHFDKPRWRMYLSTLTPPTEAIDFTKDSFFKLLELG